MRATIIPRDDRLRPKAEELIRKVYAQHYGAYVTTFPDTLVAKITADNGIECAAGLRFAADGFFSEAYLDTPIDVLLSALRHQSVRREKIFEVTSLASSAPHLTGSFLRKIIACGEAAGFEWAFFTATESLKTLLERLGLPLLFLTDAERSRVANPDTWGSYYTLFPRVYAVHRDGIVTRRGGLARAPIHG
ncbi:thermostable hemolysin [Methyloceanibacter sp.]|uniref:thermostable hemolysin n=1 Tax=Methyloceanibacter sp. TaxID=1965321 RepID=UPI002D46517A|nr:thermostable hemolysin [Methyloceanibacter sp.]HZP08608.1 thermostable hemolysin [Methyloceanibacter sp.]